MDTKEQPVEERLADDLLVGAGPISDELGCKEHQVYYIKNKKHLPIGKLGKFLVASRRKLRRAVAAHTA